MDRLHPGVYIQEVPSGVQPIEGVSTSTAGFIGKTEMGSIGAPLLVTSNPEFQTNYGSYIADSFLAHSVLQFFNNGGKKIYIVRVAGSGAVASSISLKDRKTPTPAKTLTISAKNPGEWGNKLDIAIVDSLADADNFFTLQVFRDQSDLNPPLDPLLLETIADLSMDPDGSNYVETAVTANSKYITVTADSANLATSGAGTSRGGKLPVGNGADLLKLGVSNGGTEAVGAAGTSGTSTSAASPSTNPPADKRSFLINIDADGAREITLPGDAATGASIAAAIQAAVRLLVANNALKQAAYSGFTCTFGATYVLTSGSSGTGSSVVVTNSAATPIRLAAGTFKFVIQINGDGPHEITLTGPLADGVAIQNAILAAVSAVSPKRASNAAAFTAFKCLYDTSPGAANPSFLLTSGIAGSGSSVLVTNAGSNNVAQMLKLGPTNGGAEVTGSAILRPAASSVPTQYHLGEAVVSGNVAAVVLGDDGGTPVDQDYIDGLTALDTVQDVNILAIPGIGSQAVVDAGTNYCTQRGDCFFIGDMKPDDDTMDEARTFVNSLTVKSSFGAVYYPWLKMLDPTGIAPQPILSPPSGYVAGMYARIDSARGVFKAPAGTEANIGGSVGLATDTTDAQQDFLNPVGVNVIRSFPAAGVVIWGARTLATRSNPEYRYIPVRRTAIFLEQSIYNGIQYAVFEPNDFGLWSSLRLNINAFMMLQFRAGAFQGKSPSDAFFVKVDETTTTQADIDAGVVNILVGFAPLKPAEFVVLQLTQKVNQAAA